MATAVFFHAHPDDEAIATGGTIAKAVADGHRAVVVFATNGELGEVRDSFLDPGEEVWERRVQECHAAASILGVHRLEFLGYHDSGMMGEPTNDADGSFWRTPVDAAAERLAAILRAEHADLVTCYDENGAYGHPDHIQVHRVAVRAAALAGTARVFESTIDRDRLNELIRRGREFGIEDVPHNEDVEAVAMGLPAELITTRVDCTAYVDTKRAAMRAHASQIDEGSFFLSLPADVFAEVFGWEVYVRRGAPAGTVEHSLFEGLA